MAYKTEIQIGVKGFEQLKELQTRLEKINALTTRLNKQSKNQVINTKSVRSATQAQNNYNKELERTLTLQTKISKVPGQRTPRPSGGGGGPTAGSKDINMSENLMLGAGFPLLFGGGAGQVAGGLLGSFVGPGFGGQILGSAVGQILEDAITRIREIGTAARSLNMDALRESVIFVNAELDTTVRRLIEAGKAQEAQNVLAAALTEQTGLSAETIERTTNSTNRLANEWEGVTAAYSGYLTLLGEPLVNALSKGLGLQSKLKVNTEETVPIVRNLALSYLGIPPALLQSLGLVKQNNEQAKVLSEEEQKRLALVTASNDKLSTKIKNTQAIADIEAQRILVTSTADKEHSAQLDYQRAQEEIRQEFAKKVVLARVQTAGLVGEEVEKTFALIEQEKQQALNAAARTHELKMQAIELEKQREKHKQMLEDIKLQTQLLADQTQSLNYQGQIISNNANLANARRQTESDLLDLQISRLERQKDEARHFLDKIKLNNIIFDKRKQQAKLEYESQLTSIRLSVSKAEQERTQIKLKEQQIKLQLEQVRLEAETIQDADLRKAALDRINKQKRSTLQVVKDMNRAADHSFETTRRIASFQQQSARYAYQGKIEALENSRAQERMAILLNNQRGSMNSLAARSGTYASNMERAANASSRMNTTQKNTNTNQPVKYAQGGYTTKPHIGMVGEAGPEYIVPERKAAAFATNYLMGARGASAIPRYAESGYVGPVNIQTGPVMQQGGTNYVTMAQFEKGLMDLSNAVSASNRSYGARRYQGVS